MFLLEDKNVFENMSMTPYAAVSHWFPGARMGEWLSHTATVLNDSLSRNRDLV